MDSASPHEHDLCPRSVYSTLNIYLRLESSATVEQYIKTGRGRVGVRTHLYGSKYRCPYRRIDKKDDNEVSIYKDRSKIP